MPGVLAKIDETRLACLWLQGVMGKDIAKEFGVGRVTVSQRVGRLGLPRRRPCGRIGMPGPSGLREHVRAFWRLSVPPAVVAEAYGLTETLIEQLFADLDLGTEGAGEVQETGAAPVPGRPIWTRDRDARLLDLPPPGRYRDLAALASEWGLPIREVQARWHRVRAGA